jgi:hypothetical protein
MMRHRYPIAPGLIEKIEPKLRRLRHAVRMVATAASYYGLRSICPAIFIALVAWCFETTLCTSARAQGINDLLWSAPGSVAQVPEQAVAAARYMDQPTQAINLYYQAQARAAVIGDSTRMGTATGNFLPSAIPVTGQAFFGAPAQATVAGSGSVAKLGAYSELDDGGAAVIDTKFVLQSLSVGSPDSASSGQTVALQSATLQYRRLLVGAGETAFADTAANPFTLDTAGPNARVTVLQQGTGGGQGRLSYTIVTPDVAKAMSPGLTSVISVESPIAEIRSGISSLAVTGTNTSPFSRYPDLITTTYYSDGDATANVYKETFHLQSSTVFRSLGLQNDSEQFAASAFGWGESLSGMYTFETGRSSNRDVVQTSVTGGQGIAHYIVDLQTALTSLKLNGNDAYLNSSNTLIPLPVLAWYASYTRNWNDFWQSSFTYSCVQLGSFSTTNSTFTSPGVSPYHQGQYAGVNLMFTQPFTVPKDPATSHKWQMGVEYLYGQKKALNGSLGHDNRALFVMAIKW